MANRIYEFAPGFLQMYDEHTGEKDWKKNFHLTKVKLEDETVVDCWICKTDTCDWCKDFDKRTDEDVVRMIEAFREQYEGEESDEDVQMKDVLGWTV